MDTQSQGPGGSPQDNAQGFDITLKDQNTTYKIDLDEHKIKIHNCYEWLHIVNDIVIALWFIIGSFFFFYASLSYAGTWLFVCGSAQMMVGPLIRVAHKMHLKDSLSHRIHF